MIYLNIFGLEFEPILIVYPIVIFVLFVGLRFFLLNIKKHTDRQLNSLLYETQQFNDYQLLLTNKRLKWVFSNQELGILKLNGYMVESDDFKILAQIKVLDKMKLKPRQRLEFLSKRFTYFVELGRKKDAVESYNAIAKILKTSKHAEATKIMDEATTVLKIYIHKDTRILPELIQKSKNESNLIVQGVIYFRIAKLYYFLKKFDNMNEYLNKAKAQLKGTYYEEIVLFALKDPSILNTK